MFNEDFADQRDAYYTPLNEPAVPQENIITQVMSQAFNHHDEDGEEHRFDRVLLDVGTATDEEVEQYIDAYYPREHCQHEYDCCANWYMQYTSYDRAGKFAVVTLSYILNI